MAEAREVHYLDGSRNQQGPVPADEIARLVRNGAIRRDTLIWYPGMPDWRPIGQVSEFASLFVQAAPPRPPAARGAAAMPPSAPMAGAYAGQAQGARPFEPPRMGFGRAIATCFRKYVDFTGRARRAEYWFWHLFYMLALIGLLALDGAVAAAGLRVAVFGLVGILAMALPSLAVSVRRLHDTDRSGWWILINFVPFGGIVYLVFLCQRGTTGENRFGPDPLGADVAGTFD